MFRNLSREVAAATTGVLYLQYIEHYSLLEYLGEQTSLIRQKRKVIYDHYQVKRLDLKVEVRRSWERLSGKPTDRSQQPEEGG